MPLWWRNWVVKHNMTEFVYRCSTCGKEYQRGQVRYLCPECGQKYRPGQPLVGVLEAVFDYARIKERFNREKPDWSLFCAVEEEYHPLLPVGNTPFFKAQRLGEQLGFSSLWIKNDALNPSGSLKDRASHLLVAEARRLGLDTVVTASTGNAACALAALCAAAGLQAIIFVPASAPPAKLVQMRAYGARVITVNGTYDDAFAQSLAYTANHPGLNRNTAYHPLTIEGKKTVGLEIFAQNGFNAPEAILVPVGDGVILYAVYKAFYDLQQAGLTDRIPRLIAVQAKGSAAIARYFNTGEYHPEPHASTVADSISVIAPANAHLAKNALDMTNGLAIEVSDEEIMAAQLLLARQSGVYAEPAAVAPLAGLIKAADKLDRQSRIVLLITGHGLKNTPATATALAGITSC